MGTWYAVHVKAGPYTWDIYPDDPGQLGDVIDGLRITTGWSEGHPVQGTPEPWTARFGVIVGHIRDVRDLRIGSPVSIRVDRDGPAGEPVAGYPVGWAPTYSPLALFVGRISDLSAAPDRRGRMVVHVTCTDHLVDLQATTIGDTAYPQELVADRITRILTEAGVAVPDDYLFGTLAAREPEPRPALELAQETLAAEADPNTGRWLAANLSVDVEYLPTPTPVPVSVNVAANTVTLPPGHGLTLTPGDRLRIGSLRSPDWNLAKNGDFSQGWPEGTSGWQGNNVIISQGQYGDGQPAVPIASGYRMDAVSAGGAAGTVRLRRTVAGLIPGDTYTLSAWLWVPAGYAAAGWTVGVPGVANAAAVTTTGQWVQRSVTFAATATSHTIEAFTNLSTFAAEAWVSVCGVQLVPGPAPLAWPYPAPLSDGGWEWTPAVKTVTHGGDGSSTVLLAESPLQYDAAPAGWDTLDLQSAGDQVTLTLETGARVIYPDAPNPDYPYVFGASSKRAGAGNAERPVDLPAVLEPGPDGWRVAIVPGGGDQVVPAAMAHLDTEWSKNRDTRIDRVVVSGANEQWIYGELPGAVPIEYRQDTQLTSSGDLANRVRYLLPEQAEDGWALGAVQLLELPTQGPGIEAATLGGQHLYMLPPLFFSVGSGAGFVTWYEPRRVMVLDGLVEGQNPNGGTYYAGIPANAELTFDGGEWSITLQLRPDIPRSQIFDWATMGVDPPYLTTATIPDTITLADLDPAVTAHDLRLVRRPD